MSMNMTGDRAFSALLFPPMNNANVDYLRQQYVGVENIIDPRQREFAMKSREIFEQNFSHEAMEYSRQVAQHYLGTAGVGMSMILELVEIDHLQDAAPTMQRWIMACPAVREHYHAQRLDGYSHSYVDNAPNVSGWKHLDYRLVNHGIVTSDDQGFDYTTYFDEVEEELPLSIKDQSVILHTWEWLTHHIWQQEDDPTSVQGDRL